MGFYYVVYYKKNNEVYDILTVPPIAMTDDLAYTKISSLPEGVDLACLSSLFILNGEIVKKEATANIEPQEE